MDFTLKRLTGIKAKRKSQQWTKWKKEIANQIQYRLKFLDIDTRPNLRQYGLSIDHEEILAVHLDRIGRTFKEFISDLIRKICDDEICEIENDLIEISGSTVMTALKGPQINREDLLKFKHLIEFLSNQIKNEKSKIFLSGVLRSVLSKKVITSGRKSKILEMLRERKMCSASIEAWITSL